MTTWVGLDRLLAGKGAPVAMISLYIHSRVEEPRPHDQCNDERLGNVATG